MNKAPNVTQLWRLIAERWKSVGNESASGTPLQIDRIGTSRRPQIMSLSTLSFSVLIWPIKSLASFVVMLAAITARLTPQALPSAILLGTYTYGTFLSSASNGRWRRIARGDVSTLKLACASSDMVIPATCMSHHA